MHDDLKKQIKEATRKSEDKKLDFSALLKLIDDHYDKMEATLSESLSQSMIVDTPLEAIFDSVTDALFTVSNSGIIRNCNKVCSRYFGMNKDKLIGASIGQIIPSSNDQPLQEFLSPGEYWRCDIRHYSARRNRSQGSGTGVTRKRGTLSRAR